MTKFAVTVIAAASLLSFVGTAATAQEGKKKKPRDPNEMVCKEEETIGSRLQTRKICMTRAQWAEQRQIDRNNVEKSQVSSCQRQAGC